MSREAKRVHFERKSRKFACRLDAEQEARRADMVERILHCVARLGSRDSWVVLGAMATGCRKDACGDRIDTAVQAVVMALAADETREEAAELVEATLAGTDFPPVPCATCGRPTCGALVLADPVRNVEDFPAVAVEVAAAFVSKLAALAE